MNKVRIWLGILAVFTACKLDAQSASVPLNDWYYHQIDRLEVLQGQFANFHSGVKPIQRKQIGRMIDSLPSRLQKSHAASFLSLDNREWVTEKPRTQAGIFNTFYRYPEDAFALHQEDLLLRVNPVLYFSYGQAGYDELNPWINTRGAEVSGMIDKKVGFYSFIGENQALFPNYVRQYTRANGVVPHEGFWKTFRSADSVDFFHVRGYFTFNPTEHINIQAGYDRLFLGDGIRSLLISDFPSNYLFSKIHTEIWKITYSVIYTSMKADAPAGRLGSNALEPLPNKYMTMHYLSYDILPNLRMGLYEAIVFGESGYDISYLNPIIFYRAVEHQNGSVDNALVGADFRFDFWRSFSLYGQFIIDEFLLSNLRERNGWWANKYGGQLGLKYYDAFTIPRLDLQWEANFTRPYTYAHGDLYSNYAHYLQPLAHPLGANFREMIFSLRYQPVKNLFLDARLIASEYGQDTVGVNWGGDILKNYANRPREFGNVIGQGIFTRQLYLDATVSYQVYPHLFVDLGWLYREELPETTLEPVRTSVVQVALRYNIARRRHEF